MRLTIRDDDVNKNTRVDTLRYIHEQFLEAHYTHTVGLLCDGLEQNKELVEYIRHTSNWNLCIHGWNHHNYCLMNEDQIADELDKCILKIDSLFDVVPQKWYLPFNGWTEKYGFKKIPYVSNIAFYHGIDVINNCQHITRFMDSYNNSKILTNVVYFNSWEPSDLALLPELLFLARNLRLDNLQDKRDN